MEEGPIGMTRLTTGLWIKIYPTSDVQFLDWNNACILRNQFSKWNWIQLEWMLIYLIQSSFMPCRFQTFQEPYQTWIFFLGSLETEMHHRSQQDQMMVKGRKSGWIHFKKGKNSKFLVRLFPLWTFMIFWDQCVKISFWRK